jgi:CheY-like chemotaxis protein
MKTLVVDDHPTTAKSISEILLKNGYEPVIATSVKHAISLLKSNDSIKLIITEMEFSEDNGFELLEFVHEKPETRKLPVLICTGNCDRQAVVKSIQLGAAGYIAKPVNSVKLIEKVKKIMMKVEGNVLIVDDEELIRDHLGAMLKREGYSVLTADSAKEAIEKLGETKIDIVISDIEMPEMTGLELLTHIKSQFPHIPVLIITGFTGKYQNNHIKDSGADGFITKPFKNVEIVESIKAFL